MRTATPSGQIRILGRRDRFSGCGTIWPCIFPFRYIPLSACICAPSRPTWAGIRKGMSGWAWRRKGCPPTNWRRRSSAGFAANPMGLIQIYECLCDPTRLRILNLLTQGELCVCHFQEILGEPQVKVSKHLAYLRAREMVVARKAANWMIYSLPANRSRELSFNLACLQDCVREDETFRRDLEKLRKLARSIAESSPACCAAKAGRKASAQ